MDRLFNMDNKFFTVMGRVADLIMLNVVFLICCLPIVTIGASLTALHYVTLKMAPVSYTHLDVYKRQIFSFVTAVGSRMQEGIS